MAMPLFIITIIEASFVSTPIKIVDGVKSRPQIWKAIKFVSLHEDIPGEVNKVFAS
jgi:hypothetical protein